MWATIIAAGASLAAGVLLGEFLISFNLGETFGYQLLAATWVADYHQR